MLSYLITLSTPLDSRKLKVVAVSVEIAGKTSGIAETNSILITRYHDLAHEYAYLGGLDSMVNVHRGSELKSLPYS